jgi:hypothetical protein
MQVLVDRASRARTDEEMDRFDDQLLRALGELRHLRDRLHASPVSPAPPAEGGGLVAEMAAAAGAAGEEPLHQEEQQHPFARGRRSSA